MTNRKQARRGKRFDRWVRYGVKHGLCSEQFCMTHDASPMSESEDAAWEEGWDPCCHVVRLGTVDDWQVS